MSINQYQGVGNTGTTFKNSIIGDMVVQTKHAFKRDLTTYSQFVSPMFNIIWKGETIMII